MMENNEFVLMRKKKTFLKTEGIIITKFQKQLQ